TGLTAIKRLNPATPLPLDDSLKRLNGRLDRDKVVRVAGDITETLKLAYTVQPHRRGVELSISAVNLSQTDLVGTVLVALPVDAVAGRWYLDGYASHTIEATASEYRNAVWLGVGKSGSVSRYPLSAVTLASGDALAWAVPMYPVRFVRLSYTTPLRAMILGWDVALRASQEGTLRTYLYPLAGEEPFREALAEYYRWQADAFEVKKFKGLLNSLRESFDFVFVDVPPILNIADASVVAKYCDGILFALKSGFSDIKIINRAIKQLSASTPGKNVVSSLADKGEEKGLSLFPKNTTEVLGAIFNMVDYRKDGMGGYNKYYRGYYFDKKGKDISEKKVMSA
ncbi:MAG: tyrosine-protein kinase family protein, partial [Nitrospinales bacterium]